MKIVKGFRLYRLDENENKRVNERMKFTEHVNLDDLNERLREWGYELKIKGFFKPYKFHDFRNNRTYAFSTLFEVVAKEFFVSYAYVVVDATEEEKERLASNHIRIRYDNIFNEGSAALIYHDVEWICFKEHRESIYSGKMFKIDYKTGEETEKDVVDPRYEISDHIHNIEKLEYIYK